MNALMSVVRIACLLSIPMALGVPGVAQAQQPLAHCAGGDTETDGRPNFCNFVWVGGTTHGGRTFVGNNHWWYKLYWSADFPNNMNTLRSDGKARMEIAVYKPPSKKCDKWNLRGVRDITMPKTVNFEKPPKNGCGNSNIKEEWKLEITNTKNFVANQSGAVSVDIDSVGSFGAGFGDAENENGLEVNLSWVKVKRLLPDSDIWLGKLTSYCDQGGGKWVPKQSHPNAGILQLAIPACP